MLMFASLQELGKFIDENRYDYDRQRNLLNCRLIKAGRAFGEKYLYIQLFLSHASLSIHFWSLAGTGCWAKQICGLTQSGCS